MHSNWHGASEQQWNSMSKTWIQNSEEMWERGSRKTIIPLFKKHIQANAGTVLDAGCGDGYGTMKLGKEGYTVIGIDLAEDMIEKARQRITPELAINFLQSDIVSLPFSDSYFSAILSVNCLEWVESPLTALQELRRVLKPGGVICLGVLGPTAAPREHSYNRLYGKSVVCNTMMPWEFQRLAEENGFTILDGEGVYKRGVDTKLLGSLSQDLRQALTFMWLFIMLKK